MSALLVVSCGSNTEPGPRYEIAKTTGEIDRKLLDKTALSLGNDAASTALELRVTQASEPILIEASATPLKPAQDTSVRLDEWISLAARDQPLTLSTHADPRTFEAIGHHIQVATQVPWWSAESFHHYHYLFWQRMHGRPMVNGQPLPKDATNLIYNAYDTAMDAANMTRQEIIITVDKQQAFRDHELRKRWGLAAESDALPLDKIDNDARAFMQPGTKSSGFWLAPE